MLQYCNQGPDLVIRVGGNYGLGGGLTFWGWCKARVADVVGGLVVKRYIIVGGSTW